MKNYIVAGLIGAAISFIMCFLINYFFVPVPQELIVHAIGNGISGIISGFMAGFFRPIWEQKKRKLKNIYNNK